MTDKPEVLKNLVAPSKTWKELIEDYEFAEKDRKQQDQQQLLNSKMALEKAQNNQSFLASVREHYDRHSEVGYSSKAFSFRFLPGEKSLKDLTVFEESCSGLRPQDLIISLWRTREALAEFERQKAENDQSVSPSGRQRLASPGRIET